MAEAEVTIFGSSSKKTPPPDSTTTTTAKLNLKAPIKLQKTLDLLTRATEL